MQKEKQKKSQTQTHPHTQKKDNHALTYFLSSLILVRTKKCHNVLHVFAWKDLNAYPRF